MDTKKQKIDLIAANDKYSFKFNVGDKVKKVKGNYTCVGTVIMRGLTTELQPRYNVELDIPKGLLFVYSEDVLDVDEEEIVISSEKRRILLESWRKSIDLMSDQVAKSLDHNEIVVLSSKINTLNACIYAIENCNSI